MTCLFRLLIVSFALYSSPQSGKQTDASTVIKNGSSEKVLDSEIVNRLSFPSRRVNSRQHHSSQKIKVDASAESPSAVKSGNTSIKFQREILNLLGLPRRPRLSLNTRLHGRKMSAPRYMMDLYNKLENNVSVVSEESGVCCNGTLADSRASGASTIMSYLHHIRGARPKISKRHATFRFNMETPLGEKITNAEFRIYKEQVIHREITSWQNATYLIKVYQMLLRHPKIFWRDVHEVLRDLQRNATQNEFWVISTGSAGYEKVQFWAISTVTQHQVVEPARILSLLDTLVLRSWESGWQAFDVSAAGQAWAKEPKQNFGIELSIQTYAGVELNASSAGFVGFHGPQEKRPFLVSFYRNDGEQLHSYQKFYAQKPRSRRSPRSLGPQFTNVGGSFKSSSSKSCSRRMLYVSFQKLGWQDWIIAPEGYSAFFCFGECSFPLSAHMNATNHAIVQTLVHLMNPSVVPKPCCSPTKLTAISVLYFDDSDNVVLKKYTNMVVKACGCH